MRRCLLALLAWLVAVQMGWAGAQLCCVEELADDGSGNASLSVGEQAHATPSGDLHPACEIGHCHCHHAGCATPLDEVDSLAAPRDLRPAPETEKRLKSHIPAGLERPNWRRA